VFGRLVEFLNRPDSAGVVYRLGHTKPESVMVEIALPGWHTIARGRSESGEAADPPTNTGSQAVLVKAAMKPRQRRL
jgi:hypothetical protein